MADTPHIGPLREVNRAVTHQTCEGLIWTCQREPLPSVTSVVTTPAPMGMSNLWNMSYVCHTHTAVFTLCHQSSLSLSLSLPLFLFFGELMTFFVWPPDLVTRIINTFVGAWPLKIKSLNSLNAKSPKILFPWSQTKRLKNQWLEWLKVARTKSNCP